MDFISQIDQLGATWCAMAEAMASVYYRLTEHGIPEDTACEMVADLWERIISITTGTSR